MFTDLLSLIFNKNLSKKNIEYAFMVHPRGTDDIFRRYKFLKIFPKFVVNGILMIFWPTYGGYIKFIDKDNNTKYGGIIISPLTGKQMLKFRKLASHRVKLAAKLAKIKGAKVIGLGALTSVVTNGGKDVTSKLKDIHLTTGNGLTVATTTNDVLNLIDKHNIKGPISIIGATGSIGKGIIKILDKRCENDLILIGKNKERTDDLKNGLSRNNIICTTDINENNKAELVIVTTSADGALLDYHLLKNTKIIYDITQPKNTPDHIITDNKILYIDGSLIKLPENVKIGMDIGLEKGIAFSCFSETVLIAVSDKHHLKSDKDLIVENIDELSKLAKEHNFTSHLIENGHK